MRTAICLGLAAALAIGSSCERRSARASSPRTITIAQSGSADVIGSDSAALQRAADLLRPGDTLSIGPGTYQMDNSLLAPSGVTVRGVAGRTIIKKSRAMNEIMVEGERMMKSSVKIPRSVMFRSESGVTVAAS